MAISSRSSPTACGARETFQVPSAAVVVEARATTTAAPLPSDAALRRETWTPIPPPGDRFTLPVMTGLNCLRLTCGSGSWLVVLELACAQLVLPAESALAHSS